MSRRWIAIAGLIAVAALASACQPATPTQSPAQPAAPVGLANPASVYCAQQGYKSDIRTDTSGGQAGYCVFPDGSECEEWAFLRGECGQDKSFCAKNGGTIQKGDNGATCTFKDGSSCLEYDFFTGKCKPGSK